jgi:hypothetical protein
MKIINIFKYETCPSCQQNLLNTKDKGVVIKHCPEGHYKKEIIPYIESVIEYRNSL